MVSGPLRPPRRPGSLPRIPGYRLESVIGRGGTGVVYRARQLTVEREVALKVLHPELAGKTRTISRLRREARTTARLAHPHIVSAIDMGEVDGHWWYAMELVDGPSLALRLRQEGRLGEREALRLFIPLCEALVHTFEHGVVHRDIKPGNILIDRAGGARLADLGLAFADDDPLLTTSEGTLGTPHYISPEQARDPIQVDIRSDIWSFGATLFHAVCGRPPFAGESTAEVLSGVLYAPVADPRRLEPDLSRGLEFVLRKCLARVPSRRYQTPSELLADLERVRERRRPKVREGSLDPVEGRASPWIPWITGVVVLVAAGLTIWLFGVRPWRAQDGVAPYEPLEAVVRALDDPRGDGFGVQRARLRELIAEIERIYAVPIDHDLRWRETRDRLLQLRESVLAEIQAQTAARLQTELEQSDHVGAREVLGTELNGRVLERTGYSLEHLPEGQFKGWLDASLQRVRLGLDEDKKELARQLEQHIEESLVPAVAAKRAAQRWRDAYALLDQDVDELVAATRFDARGFPPAELEEVLSPVVARLDRERQELREAWAVLDAALHAEVVELAEELEADLLAGELELRAADVLGNRFFAELSERQLPPDQMPEGLPFATEARHELERRTRELAALQAQLKGADASEGLEVLLAVAEWLDESASREYWARRDYRGLETLWENYRVQLRQATEGEENAWSARLEDFIEVRIEEARYLEALLDRAAEGVRERNNQEYVIRIKSIGESGVIHATSDPRTGFFLVLPRRGEGGADEPDEGSERIALDLRELPAVEVELLAGIAEASETIESSRDRLAKALFRFREGEPARAREVLGSGALPRDPTGRRLADDLGRRVELALRQDTETARRRAEEAGELLAGLSEERIQEPHSKALRVIQKLRREYGDVPAVQEALPQLDRWEELIETRPWFGTQEDFERMYEPYECVLFDRDRVRLTYDFAVSRGGKWYTGGWIPNAVGMVSPGGVIRRDEILRPRQELLLPLTKPLEIDGGPLVVRIELEQADDLPRLVIVSVADFHLALCGPGLAEVGEFSYQVARGSVEELLATLGRGQRPPGGTLLEQGREYVLQLTLHRGQGRLQIELGEKGQPLQILERRSRPRASGSAGRAGGEGPPALVVRAWERLTVSRVEIEGNRPHP